MILGIVNSFGTLVTVTKGYCTILPILIMSMRWRSRRQPRLCWATWSARAAWTDIQKQWMRHWRLRLRHVGMAVLMCLGGNTFSWFSTRQPEIIALGRRILVIESCWRWARGQHCYDKCLIVGRRYGCSWPRPRSESPSVGRSCRWPWLLGNKLGWGLGGVWIAMAADECVRGLIYAVHLRKERWKKNFKGVKTEQSWEKA